MNKWDWTGEHGNKLLPVMGLFLGFFLLLGMAFRLAPEKRGQAIFPLLEGITSRLDVLAEDLHGGIPVRDGVEAFFENGFTLTDSG